MDLRPSPGRLGPNSGYSYGEPRGYADSLLMTPIKRNAVGRFDEPAKLAIFRGPEHPFKGEFARNLRPAARSCVT